MPNKFAFVSVQYLFKGYVVTWKNWGAEKGTGFSVRVTD